MSFFNGFIFTTLRAGFALKVVGSPVKGLIPLRALVAGFLTTVILYIPGWAKAQPAFTCACIIICRDSKTSAIFFLGNSVLSTKHCNNSVLVKDFFTLDSFLPPDATLAFLRALVTGDFFLVYFLAMVHIPLNI